MIPDILWRCPNIPFFARSDKRKKEYSDMELGSGKYLITVSGTTVIAEDQPVFVHLLPMALKAVIAGIDEAGRGALAGPVVAAACVLSAGKRRLPPFIRDSKKLTPEGREEAYAWIIAHCTYGIGMAEALFIDANGILAATERAMQQAVEELRKSIAPTYLLVDGRDKFWFDYPHSSIIRGDETEPCISAASIIAKVTRDRIMEREHQRFPLYGFEEHKGYGAPAHLEAIRIHGPSPLHRTTFLKNLHLEAHAIVATALSPRQPR
jgi:ribonuclease HII